MIELHRRALLNVYAMLDTIAWDILFEAPHGLGATWTFMSEYADAILYNSNYTRKHVLRRFPLAASTRGLVCHHSFNPQDYGAADPYATADEGDYIFLVGNSYEHKALYSAIELLTTGFPQQKLRVLGLKSHPSPRVEAIESGQVDVTAVDSLFAEAKLIVFPSSYEGFGFPVLKGLSYGRTVLARKSELLMEVAAGYRGPGRLVPFNSDYEFVDRFGRILHNAMVEEIELGSALQPEEKPLGWGDIARNVLDFLDGCIEDPDRFRWVERERAIRYLEAHSF